MSIYYLVDMHVPVIANSRIVDVIATDSDTDEIRVDGLTPIKIPNGVKVTNPTSFSDLLTQKYAGLLAQYPGFTNVVYDDLLDDTGIQVAAPPTYLRKSGSRGTNGGAFNTLDADVSPTVISQCVVVWESFTWRYVDNKDNRIERYYVEVPDTSGYTTGVGVGVSVNSGANYTFTTANGAIVNIPLGQEGSLVTLDFTPSLPLDNNRILHAGSWAVIY